MEEEPSSPRRDKGIFHSPLGILSIPGARRSRLRVMKPSRLPFVISSRHYPRFRPDFRPQIWGSSSFLLFIISIFRLFHLGFQKSAERDHFSRSLSFFFPSSISSRLSERQISKISRQNLRCGLISGGGKPWEFLQSWWKAQMWRPFCGFLGHLAFSFFLSWDE